ncbi:MAG: 4-hydroxythreonine-4-phosphate dehydrogenase PdxA [Bacteroidota bacterium]|nr:4-hydroxythreonine-4-phosphate dehydrogenase PdxA [Bacteroidota bacterium]
MSNNTKHIPILAITMGDPAGIGPEIAAKAFAESSIYSTCKPLLIGHSQIMEKAIKIAGVNLKINKINNVSEAVFTPGTIDIYEIEDVDVQQIQFGQVSEAAGDLAFKAVKTAIELALQKKVDGTVTGPINKESINKAGHHFSGHTEIYAHFTNTAKYAMLLCDENFRVIHVTTHVSLRKACDLIKKERVLDVIRLMNKGLNDLGIESPRIGVAGLNPHSGDGGLFGDEEINEIGPAIQEAQKEGILASGPVPPDTLFALANGGKFDGCVAMYHDQGHIPFKVLGFNWDQEKKTMKSVKGVNITLGLPIIRTSVDHGTAFEIAGKGIASPDALFHAIEYAVRLYRK